MSNLNFQVSESLLARFFAKVVKTVNCWLWQASKDGKGYGQFRVFGRGASPAKAHRVSYMIENGEVPDGKEVCHRCDNPSCVNPDHLFLGTHYENMQDMKAKRRGCVPSKGKPGELNNAAKLNAMQVHVIRQLRGTASQTQLAKLCGVDRSCISLIQRNKKWRHLNGSV